MKTFPWLPTALRINSRLFHGGLQGLGIWPPPSFQALVTLNPSCSSYTSCLAIPSTYQGCFCLRAFAAAVLFAWTMFLFALSMVASSSSCQISVQMSLQRGAPQESSCLKKCPRLAFLTHHLAYSFKAPITIWSHTVWFDCSCVS